MRRCAALCFPAATVSVEQLTEQLSILAAVIAKQRESIELMRRALFPPAVEIRRLNSATNDRFHADPYRSLAELIIQSCRRFGVDGAACARFHWLPALGQGAPIGERLDGRRTLRNERDWQRFLDHWNEQYGAGQQLIVLYFVPGQLSPSLVQRPPPLPPLSPLSRTPLGQVDEEKSESDELEADAARPTSATPAAAPCTEN